MESNNQDFKDSSIKVLRTRKARPFVPLPSLFDRALIFSDSLISLATRAVISSLALRLTLNF
jgi:hypothetical protein